MWRRLLALSLLVCFATPFPAQAGFPGEVGDHVQLQLGGTLGTFDTSVGVGVQGGASGAVVVFEDFLNLPVSMGIWRADGWWRFGERDNLDFGYVSMNREAAREIAEDIQFGDYTFRAGARVTGEFDTRFVYAAYRHDFLKLDVVRIGGSIGASVVTLAASLRAAAGVVDSTGQELQRESEVGESITLPVPLLGVQVDWAVTHRGVFQLYERVFFLNTSSLRGGMTESTLRYCYFLTQHLGLGVGYDHIAINIPKIETGGRAVRANYNVQGVSGYVRYSF